MAETPGRRNIFAEHSAVRPPQTLAPVPPDPAKSIPQVVAEDLIEDYNREADSRPDLGSWFGS